MLTGTFLLVVPANNPETGSAIALEQQLVANHHRVEWAEFSNFESRINELDPDLLVLVTAEHAQEIITALEGTPERQLQVAVIADRAALPQLRKLNRKIMSSLMAQDMPEKVIASRLELLLRKQAKTGSPSSMKERAVTGSALLSVGNNSSLKSQQAPQLDASPQTTPFDSDKKAPFPPKGTPISEQGAEPSPQRALPADLTRFIIVDDDVSRADRFAEVFRKQGAEVYLVPPDPARTRWPLLHKLRPQIVFVDARAEKERASVWLQLFFADARLKECALVTAPFTELFDEASLKVEEARLLAQVPQISRTRLPSTAGTPPLPPSTAEIDPLDALEQLETLSPPPIGSDTAAPPLAEPDETLPEHAEVGGLLSESLEKEEEPAEFEEPQEQTGEPELNLPYDFSDADIDENTVVGDSVSLVGPRASRRSMVSLSPLSEKPPGSTESAIQIDAPPPQKEEVKTSPLSLKIALGAALACAAFSIHFAGQRGLFPAPWAQALAPSASTPAPTGISSNLKAAPSASGEKAEQGPNSGPPGRDSNSDRPPSDTATPGAAGALNLDLEEEEPLGEAPDEKLEQEAKNLFLVQAPKVATCEEILKGKELKLGRDASSLSWREARAELVRGDLNAAHQFFCQAVTQNSKSKAIESLARFYLRLHAPKQAMMWLEKAEALRPDSGRTNELKMDIQNQLGAVEAARNSLLKILGVAPEDIKTRNYVAKRYQKDASQYLHEGNPAKAELWYRRAAVLNEKSDIAAAGIAMSLMKQDLDNYALSWAEQATSLNAKNTEAMIVRGDYARRQKNWDEARIAYESALKIRYDHPLAKGRLRGLRRDEKAAQRL
ncbi:MAG: hypothetical protein MK135_00825 [Polyangiaceae bacterium]|nr:hypothetical protein [Polyangiaceae bacterium]